MPPSMSQWVLGSCCSNALQSWPKYWWTVCRAFAISVDSLVRLICSFSYFNKLLTIFSSLRLCIMSRLYCFCTVDFESIILLITLSSSCISLKCDKPLICHSTRALSHCLSVACLEPPLEIRYGSENKSGLDLRKRFCDSIGSSPPCCQVGSTSSMIVVVCYLNLLSM